MAQTFQPEKSGELLEWLEYDDEAVRLMAAENLISSAKAGTYEGERADLALRLLRMTDTAIRALAAKESEALLDEENVDILRPCLVDEHLGVKRAAAESVERIGGEKAAALLEEYRESEYRLRQRIIREYISELDDPEKVAEAADNLGVFGAEAANAIDPLLRVLEESDNDRARGGAAQSIGRIGVPDEGCVAALSHAAMHDAESSVREEAIDALSRSGRESALITQTFIYALKHDIPYHQGRAATALRNCKEDADAAVRALIEARRRSTDAVVRLHAIMSLGRLMTVEAANALVACLRDPDVEIRMHAARALENGGSQAEIVVPALIEALDDLGSIEHWDMAWTEYVSDRVESSLRTIGARALEMLRSAASSHPRQRVRDAASRLCEAIGAKLHSSS